MQYIMSSMYIVVFGCCQVRSNLQFTLFRAIFVSRNIGIYSRFLSLLDTDMTQEAEIISYWRQGPTYFAESMSWWVDASSQGVSNNDIDYVQAE